MLNREQQQQPMASQYDPEMVGQLKKEIMNDLKVRREWQEKYYGEPEEYGENYGENYGYGRGRRGYGYGAGYPRRGPGFGMGRGMGPGRYYGWCPAPPPMPYRSRRQPELDFDWWMDREDYDYQRNMNMLRRQLQTELKGMERINQRMGQVRDPQVRMMLNELLQEAWQQGMDVPELMQSLNMNNQPGYTGALLDRITGPFRGIDRKSFGWGAGAALLGLLLLPSLGKSMRPLARKAMEEAIDIAERAQGVFSHAKEEFEDIVAEASFNKIKDSVANQANMGGEKDTPIK
ncbi:hypothetical protein [Desulforamulus aquiferis]|uniref:YtxH domain-containing protein n=1 Tax=Desulforamulus aquiferis TaxID=1397668 RepID=A0AAW7Z9Z2_9FIRM|nr:hypothetical protein [Desulforamulus aquiferis]MDO7786235.1 hypothetical protein [Desulforamulus aquiferis]